MPSPESTIYWNESDGRPPEVQAFVDRCDDLSVYRVDPLRTQTLHKKVKDVTAGKETSEWAFRTERILPGEDVYVLGHAHSPDQRDLPDDVSAVIEDPGGSSDLWSKDYASVYVISNQLEEALVTNQIFFAQWHLVIGIVVLGIGLVTLYFLLQFYLQ